MWLFADAERARRWHAWGSGTRGGQVFYFSVFNKPGQIRTIEMSALGLLIPSGLAGANAAVWNFVTGFMDAWPGWLIIDHFRGNSKFSGKLFT